MKFSRVARRIAFVGVAVTMSIVLVVTVVAVSLVRRSFPETSGEVAVPGMEQDVTVLRDERGVPQIYGDTITDIARAQGFVHAQDRFFEMDLRRHITSGRLAELVGPDGVETDKVVRTMGWRRVAEAELPTLEPTTRTYLQAYADGVNAYLRGRSPSQVSLEYVVLGTQVDNYTIEKWTPADSVAWLKAMAWDLRGDYAGELARARLSDRVSAAQIAELYPPYDPSNAPILSPEQWSPRGQQSAVPPALRAAGAPGAAAAPADDQKDSGSPAAATLAPLRGPTAQRAYAAASRALNALPSLMGRGDGLGSNAWVVSGDKTATGQPLLANDPHLGASVPGVWYQNGLHCRVKSADCALDVSGFSFAGMPGVIIGHNDSIAWGFTNLDPDVTDFYLEQIDGNRVRRGNGWVPLTTRTETIKVAGAKSERITVKETVHGPVLSDASSEVASVGAGDSTNRQGYAVSLAWTGLQPSKTADAVFALNLAQDFEGFKRAASLFAVPSQNLVYADVDGRIGYQAPGRIPIRKPVVPGAPPGYRPAPGWDPAYDWTGSVPFASLPSVVDPKEGFIITANQAVTLSRQPFLTTQWDYGYRSQRLRTLIEDKTKDGKKLTADDMRAMQMDSRHQFAPTLVKALLGVSLAESEQSPAEVAFTREAQDLLRSWDFTTPADDSRSSAATAYFNAVWTNLLELLFDDELPGELRANGGSRYMAAVTRLLQNPRSSWWDNRQTAGIIEGRDEILRQAQVRARLDLTMRLGKDPNDWSWGDLHTLNLEHKVLGGPAVPGVVAGIFNRGPLKMPGGSAIVNANAFDAGQGYAVTAAPSMRMVVDLADFDASTWINQTGQSGHAFQDTYDDQVDDWVEGRQDPWLFSEEAVKRRHDEVLTLTPAAS